MENLAKLVSSAIGYNADRGDTVEVINMRFVEEDADFDEPLDLFFGLEKKLGGLTKFVGRPKISCG